MFNDTELKKDDDIYSDFKHITEFISANEIVILYPRKVENHVKLLQLKFLRTKLNQNSKPKGLKKDYFILKEFKTPYIPNSILT